ncbi:MAG: amidohydrolase family protein [Chloroflexota bacterium]
MIDFHTHIFPPGVSASREAYAARDGWFGALYANPRAKLATGEDLVAEMDRSGVDASVACGFGWSDPSLCAESNDYVLQMAGAYPGRILPFAVVNPLWGARAVVEMERCARLGALGIGELMPDGQGYTLENAKLLAPVAAAAATLRLTLLTHSSEPVGHAYPGKGTVSPQTLLRFAEMFPEVTLVCAHWGGGLPFLELMPEVRQLLANVYYDTAAGPFLYRDAIFKAAVAAVGAEKLLFATDYPLLGQVRYLARLRGCGLETEALAAVLGGNAERLLNLGKQG